MDNLTDYNTFPPSSDPESETSCIDRDGREILDGFLYTPGHDACQVCTCVSGSPGLCRTVLCAPPSNCQYFRVKDRCCEWMCIDDVRTGDDGEMEHGNGAADIGLKLVACGVTAIVSLALLFFLIYRLRQRKMRDHAAAVDRAADGNGSAAGDQGSLDSVAMTNLSGPFPSGDGSRSYNLYGWMWWKPQDDFVCQPPPPSYDETVANDRPHNYYSDRNVDNDDIDDDVASSGSDAPSYSQIHHDAVLQTSMTSTTTVSNLPVGATLVLPQPAPPLSDLHHVDVESIYRSPRDVQNLSDSCIQGPRYSRSPRDAHNYSADAIQVPRLARSRQGPPVGPQSLVPHHPAHGDPNQIELDTRTLPSTSSRRSYPGESYYSHSQSPTDETPSRRSRSRNPTPTSSSAAASTSRVISNVGFGHQQSRHQVVEAGHRTLPSSSRGRRSPASSESSRLSVPNPRSSLSNSSLHASIDV